MRTWKHIFKCGLVAISLSGVSVAAGSAKAVKLTWYEPPTGIFNALPDPVGLSYFQSEYLLSPPESSIADVWEKSWISQAQTEPFHQLTKEKFWRRFAVVNDSDEAKSFTIANLRDYTPMHAEFWLVKPDSAAFLGQAGGMHTGELRSVPSPMPAAVFSLEAHEKAWVIAAAMSPIKTLGEYRVFSQSDFLFFHTTFVALICVYVGVLGLIGVIAGSFAYSSRDSTLFWYAAFALTMAFTSAVAYGLIESLFPPIKGLESYKIAPVMTLVNLFPAVMFVRRFLRTAERLPKADKVLFGIVVMAQLAALSRLFFGINDVSVVIGDVLILSYLWMTLATGLVLFKRGEAYSGIFVAAYTAFMLSVVPWLMISLGVIRGEWWMVLLIPVGHWIEVATLAYSMALRYVALDDERVKALSAASQTTRLNTLVRVLSHDLSNQLSIILGYAAMGKEDLFNDAKQAQNAFEKIESAAKNQSDIITHVKTMHAMDTGKLSIMLAPVSLFEVFAKVQSTFEDRLKQKNIRLVVNFSTVDNIVVVAEQTSLLHQVLNNIISNAIKFSHQNSTIDVDATVDKASGYTRVKIRDHGVGMPKELLQNIFRPDVPTSRPGTMGEKGTGFGMPVVLSYMQLYKGSIETQSWQQSTHPQESGTQIVLVFLTAKQPEAVQSKAA